MEGAELITVLVFVIIGLIILGHIIAWGVRMGTADLRKELQALNAKTGSVGPSS